jgi:MoaA/NifB/PqqE/SkfB family radical SAM enzyme|tara:strand:+ start:1682 stop:2893 length:1212 start_codon:yes stop_codon:yes gene_type:complete
MDKSKLDQIICPALWDHLCVNTMGKNRLCCNAVTQDNDRFIGGFDAHWNELRDGIKEEMLAGGKPAICQSCWKKEDAGISSLRQSMIKTYKDNDRWDEFLDNIHKTKIYPVELDLKLGNYCNLSCRMCSSYSSSGVAGENKKILKETGVDLGINDYEKKFVQDKWYLQDEFVDSIKDMISNGLRHLKFTGGEPFMVPSVLKLINFCIENDYAKNIDLIIITNVTLIDEKWIARFKHFKFVNINCSLDGIGHTFEYIRHPGKWTDVKQKLDNLSIAEDVSLSINITFTFQIYNMLEIRNMVNLSSELNCNINAIILDTPPYLDVRNAPEALKDAALQMVDNIEAEFNEAAPRYKNQSAFINNIKNAIKQEQNSDTTQQFIEVSRLKDKYKNQDIETLEIWKYYE